MDSWIDIYNVFAGFAERFYIDFFFWVLNTSISASFLVAAIIILRLILKKAPKAMIVALWGMVAIRLICPFSLESALSLIPSEETIPTEQFETFETQNDDYNLHIVSNPIYSDDVDYTMPGDVGSNSLDSIYAYFGWLGGMGIMLAYSAICYIAIRTKVRFSVPHKDNIRLCDSIRTPFILGVFKPKMYLPSNIPDAEKEYVIAHENAHLKRRDHWWKPLGFVLLSLHWFNPLMWVAYILLCRDIEFACDEKVVKSLGEEGKKPYSEALLNCSVPRKMITACPVAFGETGVKDRIKSVLNYKKPAFWVILIAVILSVVVAVCFMTNPAGSKLVDVFNIKFTIISNINISTPDGVFDTYDVDEIGVAADFVKSVRIYDTPVSQSRSEDRDFSYSIRVCNTVGHDLYSYFTLNFNEDCTEVWMNDYVKPTFTYKVKNPSEAKKFFESHEIYCSTFVAGELLYSNGLHSTVGGVEGNYFYNIDSGMLLSEKTSGVLGWNTVGNMGKYELDKYNFDDKLSEGVEYNNFSPATIRLGNKRAWIVVTPEDSEADAYSYIFLEQRNGDYILVKVHKEHGTRWAYKLEKAFSDAPKSLDAAISEAILVEEKAVYGDTWRGFESHWIVEQKEKETDTGTEILAYVLTLYEDYYIEDDGTLVNGTAKAKPVMMSFLKASDGSYILTDYQPHDVKANAEESKRIEAEFPDAVVGEFNGEIEFMQEDCYEKAVAYFNIGDFAVRYDIRESMPYVGYFAHNKREFYLSSHNAEKLAINNTQHLPLWKFDSYEELIAFRERQSEYFNFDMSYNECPSFNEYITKYNEDYFEQNSLVLIYVDEPSGSFRHKVGGIVVTGDRMLITVNTVTVSPHTEDMGAWFVPVQLSKNTTDVCKSFDAIKGDDIKNSDVTTYTYSESTETVRPYIVLYENGQFQFSHSSLSSYIPQGGYEYRGSYLVLKSQSNTPETYYFLVDGNQLIFDAKKSTPLPEYKLDGSDKPARTGVPDGAVFS